MWCASYTVLEVSGEVSLMELCNLTEERGINQEFLPCVLSSVGPSLEFSPLQMPSLPPFRSGPTE